MRLANGTVTAHGARDEILPTLSGTDSAVRGCRKLEGEEDGDR